VKGENTKQKKNEEKHKRGENKGIRDLGKLGVPVMRAIATEREKKGERRITRKEQRRKENRKTECRRGPRPATYGGSAHSAPKRLWGEKGEAKRERNYPPRDTQER